MISIPMSQTPQSYVIFYIERQKLLPFPLYLYIQTYLRYQPEKKSGIPESCTKKGVAVLRWVPCRKYRDKIVRVAFLRRSLSGISGKQRLVSAQMKSERFRPSSKERHLSNTFLIRFRTAFSVISSCSAISETDISMP